MSYTSGLVIKPYWINKILNEGKIWEIRGSNTTKRGKIYLIASGTSKIFGEAILIDSFTVSKEYLQKHNEKHLIEDINNIRYKKPHAWVLKNPIKYNNPIPYKHPQGAVIWVKIYNE